jgi:dTDP-4-amino-4,6-dideoxygalactose transaminase
VAASEQVLSLPMSADLAEADQDRVVRALAAAAQPVSSRPAA